MSVAESFEHTLRTVSGMVDVVMVQAPVVLDHHLVETASVGLRDQRGRCCGKPSDAGNH